MSKSAVPPPGVYVPLVTFFQEDEEFDEESHKKHVLRLVEGGLTGLVLFGTNGEAVHCDAEDRARVISLTRSFLDESGYSHIPIIAGTGAESRRETLKFTQIAKEAGAEYALVISPHYWPFAMTKPVLKEYYQSLADRAVLPIVIYNFPVVAGGIDLDSDFLLDLAAHPNVVGCKLTCGNVGKMTRIASVKPVSEFNTLAGKSDHLLQALISGCGGIITGLGNLFPKVHVELSRLYAEGDIKKAIVVQHTLSAADTAVAALGTSGLKAAINQYYGYGGQTVRSPLPSNGNEKLKALGAIPVFEGLAAMEKSLPDFGKGTK